MLKIRNRTITVLLFALCFMIFSNLSQFYFGNYNAIREQNMDQISDINVINNLKTAANELNGKPLLILQHSTISNTFFPSSLPTNVSFTLLEDWISKNVTINYDGVSHRKDWVINGSFDTGESPWEYFTNNTDFVQIPWQTKGGEECVGITINKGQSFLKGDYSYFEENFTISEISVSNTLARLSMNYYLVPQLFNPSNNISAFVSIDIGGNEINTSEMLYNLGEGFWTEMSTTYDLSNYGQQLPENITLRVGLNVESDIGATNPSQHQKIYFDNIEFEVWTKPNEPYLIIAEDVEFTSEYSYQNITYGKGKTFIDVERSKPEVSDIKFTISKNDTFPEELNVYNITITSEAVKIFNSTIDLQDGSLYTSNTNINWQTEGFFDFLPYTYLDNWAEINKPSDWNITSVLDGYGTEKRASCNGKEFGSENLIIPKGIFTSGLWTIKAVSQNYISDRNIGVWNGSKFVSQSSLTYNDKFQVNITLNDTITFQDTQINCTINYPNGTTFWDGNQEPQSESVKFGNFTVGSNMSVGDYQVIVEWTNNNSYLTRDQVGSAEFGFKVWHHTNLTAVDPYFERVAGDPLLIKVRFLDDDINDSIDFATVTYNFTYGGSGTMTYIGLGEYFAEIDTSLLGDYYFSFNATKTFYENQTEVNLIHLKIIAQPLALEVPSGAITAMANSYVICEVNLTGAISGALISGDANMTTDWANPYQVTNHENGTFTLNFSTIDIPTQGIFQSFTITVFANKTDYGATTGFITLIVNPIQTNADANVSVVNAYSNETIHLKVNYTIEISNELILGANCSVDWQGASNIVSIADGFIVSLDTNGLSINFYTALITLEHIGYTNAFKSVSVIVNPIQTNADANISIVNVYLNEVIDLKVNYTIEGSNELILGANCSVEWQGASNIVSVSDGFIISLDTNGLSIQYYTALITLEHIGYANAFKSVSIIVNPIQTNADANISIVNVYLNEAIDIKVNYTIEGSNELILGAICSVEWQGASNIVSVSDGFIISLDTNGLSIQYYTALIKLEHVGYTNAFKSVSIIVNPIQTNVEVNISIVNAYSNEVIDLKVNYTITDSNELILGAICSVEWQGASSIVSVADGFIISLDTKGMSITFYTVLITLEQVGYANAFKSVSVTISEQNVNLKVAINSLEVSENFLVATYYNEVITLSCRAFAALEQIYLSGSTITFINDQYEQNLVKYDNSWFNTSISISTSTFSLGINSVYIEFQQDNYSTTTFSFQILVNQIEFDAHPINFQDSIEVNPGEQIQIRINLTDFRTNNFIENATISYSWDFGLGNFEEIGSGIYELELVIPENIRGNYKITLIISKEGTVYKTTQDSFILVINEPEFPIILIVLILAISAAIISVLAILSLRAYVFLPKKKKKDLELQQRIQLFKDVWNIQAFLLIHKGSGLPIYQKNISIFKNQDETMISGFIQAISIFSESLVGGDTLVNKIKESQDKYLKNVFELDFKYFYLLVCEYGATRAIVITKERSSNRLKKQLYLLAVAINVKFPEKLDHFNGVVNVFKDGIDVLLNQYLFLYNYESFSLTNNELYFTKIKNSGDLTIMETRIINVILSEFRAEKNFELQTLVGFVSEENKDLVIDGIRALIKKKILVSPYLNKFGS